MRKYINDSWYFKSEFKPEYLEKIDTKEFEKVRIPHTVKEIPLNYVNNEDYQMVSTYYTELDLSEYKEKECFLVFEGNAHLSEVYINGELVATHKCGYTGFRVHIDDKFKTNVARVTVKLDSRESTNIPPFGNVIDYLTYGGIYRDTYLDIRNNSYIDDIFVKADMNKSLILKTDIKNIKAGQKLRIKIADLDETLDVKREYTFNNMNVKLWDVDNPNLYELTAELIENDSVIDTYKVNVGFRTITSDVNGIYLNGEKIKLRGLNRHQSYAYVGYAMPERVERRDAQILKYELGLNAVRTSHYPDSQYFIDECDKIGLLVLTEIPGWQHIGELEWQDIAVQNVEDMILENRNHPSIFLWGVRINESMDHHELYTRTNAKARELDDTRLIGGVRYLSNSELLEDVYTINDFVHEGDNIGVRPRSEITEDTEKALLVTEYNGHMYPTKMFDDEPHRTNHLKRHCNVINAVAGSDEHAGSFGWCMADYNTHKDFGSGDQICYHGVLDIFRNKKIAAYVYESQTDDKIVLRMNTSMNIGDYPAARVTDMMVLTNCDRVALYKNDEFIREFYPSEEYKYLKHPPIFIEDAVSWWGGQTQDYKVVGIKDNKEVAELRIEAFKELHFNIESDTNTLIEGISYDVASVTIEAVNQANNHLSYFNEPIVIESTGDIELIGPKVISLKGGFGGFYIKSKNVGSGNVNLYYNNELIKTINYRVIGNKC